MQAGEVGLSFCATTAPSRCEATHKKDLLKATRAAALQDVQSGPSVVIHADNMGRVHGIFCALMASGAATRGGAPACSALSFGTC